VCGGIIDDHFWTEQALAASPSLTWTINRHNLYAELFLQGVGQVLAGGALYSATGGQGRAYVAREDCARADAAALVRGEGRRIFDISGPAAVTQDQIAALLSELSGKPVVHHDVPDAALRQGLADAGLPSFFVDALAAFDHQASQGQHAVVTDAVEVLTGQAPISVEAFLRANTAALA
jgi:NAD(P)H dehydrogenase (quinone)